jgi:hypothetical protein
MPDYFTLLRDRVTLKCRSIDRIFLQAYVPKLQTVGQVCTFLRWQRRFPVPSSAAFGKIGDAYVEAIYAYAKAHNIAVVRFEKGQDKEKTARPFLEVAAREGKDRVVLIGIAQEKAFVWRSWKSRARRRPLIRTWNGADRWPISITSISTSGTRTGARGSGRLTPMPPIRFGSGSTAMSGLNGNSKKLELLMRPSTMGSVLVKIQPPCKICDRLGPGAVKNFFWRWLHRLPTQFSSADWKAGYVYELAFRQFEISDTYVFDRPQAGRKWFEGVIRDHLDVGRPDQVMLIFDRRLNRSAPGPFRTRVLTEGVDRRQ